MESDMLSILQHKPPRLSDAVTVHLSQFPGLLPWNLYQDSPFKLTYQWENESNKQAHLDNIKDF